MKRRHPLLLLAPLLACSSTSSNPPADAGAPPDVADAARPVGADATVDTFANTNLYFTGSDNKRTVDAVGAFPDRGTYQNITLHLSLACPSGRCDPWDRFGTIGIVTARGDKPESDTVIELARFITPYGVGGKWDYDLTSLRPLLTGEVTLRAFIDTWVGPGSSYGNGWSLTASFEMVGGVPEREAVSVVPVWTLHSGAYGDPAKPISASFSAQNIPLTKGATSWELRTFITGHGQGNAANCAEFCPRDHTLTVGGHAHTKTIWRADCAKTAVAGQQGTFTLSRAGWCPGADVKVWSVDVTADLAGASAAAIGYDVQSYENTCRPDSAACAGCTLGTSCAFDGGNHTEPSYFVSSALIAYR